MSASDVAIVTVAPGGGGCQGNAAPVAVAGDDKEGQTGAALTFSAVGSTDSNGTIQSYHWLFSDGQEASGMTVSHAFLVAGLYLATLTVTDNCGEQDVDIVSIDIDSPGNCAGTFGAEIEGPANGQAGQPVTFVADPTQDLNLLFAWSFGDGTTAFGSSVTHTYQNAGAFTVSLIVTQQCGAATNAAAPKTHVINIAPQQNLCLNNNSPDVTINGPSSGTVGATLNFNAVVQDESPATVTYAWAFGDGLTGNSQQAPHAFAAVGSYTVQLTVTDSCGLTDSTSKAVQINASTNNCANGNVAPVANAGPDRQANTQQPITLDGGASNDSDGQITNYWWNFGDGQYTGWQAAATAPHTYAAAGTYQAKLWVKDNCGTQSQADIALVTVTNNNACANNTAPTANAGPDRQGTVGVSLSFTGSGSDPNGQVSQYRWGFGNGQYTPWQTQPNTQHTYASAGTFTASLQVMDNCGVESALDTAIVTIAQNNTNPCEGNHAPTADAGANVQGSVNTPVYLNGQGSSDSDNGQSLQYQWNFGDGQSSAWVTSVSVPHTYTQSGTFTASLSVKDSCNAVSQADTTQVTISGAPTCSGNVGPVAEAGPNTTGVVEVPVTLNGTGSSDSNGQVLQYWWNFGDGQFTGWQSNAIVSHAYVSTGSYMAKLWVRDSCGAMSAPDNTTVTISTPTPDCAGNQPPTANAGNAPDLDVGQVHTFTAAGSVDPNHSQSQLTFNWTFGDGHSANGYTVQHAYAQQGTYTVMLSVQDPCGRGDVDTDIVDVIDSELAATLVADFRVLKLTDVDQEGVETWEEIDIENEEIELGLRVKFDASPSEGATSYLWNFGGQMGTNAQEIRAFDVPGERQVSLTVYNSGLCGACSDVEPKTLKIKRSMQFLDALPWSPGESTGLAVDGNYGWTSHMTGMMKTLDLSDPANHQVLGTLQTPAGRAIAAGDGYVYLCTYGNSVYVYDQDDLLTNPNGAGSNPPQARVFNSGGCFSVVAARGLAFIAAESNGLRIIKPMPNGPPIEMGYYQLPAGRSARALAVTSDVVYLSDNGGDVYVIDVHLVNAAGTPIGSLTELYELTFPPYIRYISVSGSNVVVANDTTAFLIRHFSPFGEPIVVSSVELAESYGGGTSPTSILVHQDRLYVSFGPYAEFPGVEGVGAAKLNLADSNAPYFMEGINVENYSVGGLLKGPIVEGNLLYWSNSLYTTTAVRIGQP